ncbi:MAG: TetR/AcrR family transcriptional regulator [Spirochaetes bacterium]|nr:TetR/AcrR family transcriptional regulator [Spirochaetota bacterium]
MPRTPRNIQEVDSFKQQILDAAAKIVIKEGFNKLSMRKIASVLGVTATTLYNYFTNKDELYFYIRIRGFELLYQLFESAYNSVLDSREKMRALILAYINFGIEYPDYYEIMFINRNVPKFMDCIGTPLEDVGAKEKEIALKPFAYVIEKLQQHCVCEPHEAYDTALQLWIECNGVVSLYNSRLIREVHDNPRDFVNTYVEIITQRYVPLE